MQSMGDFLSDIQAELATRALKGQSEAIVVSKLANLREGLLALQRADVMSHGAPDDMVRDLKRHQAQGLWKDIPESVVEIDFGGGAVKRESTLPANEQIKWNLKQVDDHAHMLSKGIGRDWDPVIK